jgi:general secretion pathway protein N
MSARGSHFTVLLLALALPGPCSVSLAQQPVLAEPFFPDVALDALSTTRERPLFAPSRRPPPPPSPPPPPAVIAPAAVEQPLPSPPPVQPPAVRLVGVLIESEMPMAIIEHQTTGEIIRMQPGAALDLWVLSIVDPRTIAFEHEGRREVYALFEN